MPYALGAEISIVESIQTSKYSNKSQMMNFSLSKAETAKRFTTCLFE